MRRARLRDARFLGARVVVSVILQSALTRVHPGASVPSAKNAPRGVPMPIRLRWLMAGGCLAILILQTASAALVAQGHHEPPSSLTGLVASPEEGPMEGVLVSARKEGATQTVTV